MHSESGFGYCAVGNRDHAVAWVVILINMHLISTKHGFIYVSAYSIEQLHWSVSQQVK